MRRFPAVLVVLAIMLAAIMLAAAPAADALSRSGVAHSLAREMSRASSSSGIYVEDLATGQRIYRKRAGSDRVPASNEKLYTTVAALERFGNRRRLRTTALAATSLTRSGTLEGNLYLRGEGDPTLSSARIEVLAQDLADAGLTRVTGRVVGDDSAFDHRRGPPSSGYRISSDLGGQLGALMLNRGFTGYSYQSDPPAFAASALAAQLRDAGVKVPASGRAGVTPDRARPLATRRSPTIGTLIRYMNQPSDNYIAEMLLKAVGTTTGRVGTTRRGAAIARSVARNQLGASPQVADGSGLSRANGTSPRELVRLLEDKLRDNAFFGSLAVMGQSGTLQYRLRSSYASGRCRGKTGTLSNVSALSGYCLTASGDTLAFSILMNRVYPTTARTLQDRIVSAIARYGP